MAGPAHVARTAATARHRHAGRRDPPRPRRHRPGRLDAAAMPRKPTSPPAVSPTVPTACTACNQARLHRNDLAIMYPRRAAVIRAQGVLSENVTAGLAIEPPRPTLVHASAPAPARCCRRSQSRHKKFQPQIHADTRGYSNCYPRASAFIRGHSIFLADQRYYSEPAPMAK